MMKCRGMGASMRKMGGGSMKPVAMKEGKMVERKASGMGIPRMQPPFMGKVVDKAPAKTDRTKGSPVMQNRMAARQAASSERQESGMADRRAYGKSIKRKMKGKKV